MTVCVWKISNILLHNRKVKLEVRQDVISLSPLRIFNYGIVILYAAEIVVEMS